MKAQEKPIPETYGWYNSNGFDDEPSGWLYESGEEEYYKALKKWEENNNEMNYEKFFDEAKKLNPDEE